MLVLVGWLLGGLARLRGLLPATLAAMTGGTVALASADLAVGFAAAAATGLAALLIVAPRRGSAAVAAAARELRRQPRRRRRPARVPRVVPDRRAARPVRDGRGRPPAGRRPRPGRWARRRWASWRGDDARRRRPLGAAAVPRPGLPPRRRRAARDAAAAARVDRGPDDGRRDRDGRPADDAARPAARRRALAARPDRRWPRWWGRPSARTSTTTCGTPSATWSSPRPGLLVLAIAALDPAAWGAGRSWVVVLAASKTALLAWSAVTEDRFGTRSVPDLRGWIRRSPFLAVGAGAHGARDGRAARAGSRSRRGRRSRRLSAGAPWDALIVLAGLLTLPVYARLLVVGRRAADEPGRRRGARVGGAAGPDVAAAVGRPIPEGRDAAGPRRRASGRRRSAVVRRPRRPSAARRSGGTGGRRATVRRLGTRAWRGPGAIGARVIGRVPSGTGSSCCPRRRSRSRSSPC